MAFINLRIRLERRAFGDLQQQQQQQRRSKKDPESAQPDEVTLDDIIEGSKPKRRSGTPHSVHAPNFPWSLKESWYVVVRDVTRGMQMYSVQHAQWIQDLEDYVELEVKIQAPKISQAKRQKFEVAAFCDSYTGCEVRSVVEWDIERNEKLEAFIREREAKSKKREAAVAAAAAAAADGTEAPVLDDDEEKSETSELDKEEEEAPGKWYYLGSSSFLELILNIVVLGLLCMFIFNQLMARGYWQKYIEPGLSVLGGFAAPLAPFVAPLSPIVSPIIAAYASLQTWLAERLTAEPPKDEQVRPSRRRGRAAGGRSARGPASGSADDDELDEFLDE